AVVATAAMPKMRPVRAGPTPRFDDRCSASTGSTMEIVAETVTTATAHAAIAGVRTTAAIGTDSRAACRAGRSIQRNVAATTSARTATERNGAAMPPTSYSQPPIDGPSMNEKLVPDIT